MANRPISTTAGGQQSAGNAPQTWAQLMQYAPPRVDQENIPGAPQTVNRAVPVVGQVSFSISPDGQYRTASYVDPRTGERLQLAPNADGSISTFKKTNAGVISDMAGATWPVFIALGAGALQGAGAAAGTSGTAAGTTAAGTGGGISLGSGLTPGAGGVTGLSAVPPTSYSLASPIATGASGTGVGLSSAAAGSGLASGLASINPSLASSLTTVGSGLTPAEVASGASAPTGAASSASGATPGATTAGTAATSASAMSKILDGTATSEDWLKALGQVAPGLVGAYASDQQSGALGDLAKQLNDAANARYTDLTGREEARYQDLKAQYDAAVQRQQDAINYGRTQTQPYRDQLTGLMADPSSFLKSPEVTVPVQQGTDTLARSLSVGGNPIGSGNALQQLQDYSTKSLYGALQGKESQLAGFGGLSSFGSSGASVPGTSTSPSGNISVGSGVNPSAGANTSLASLQADNNIWNSLGAAASNVFTPQKTLAEQIAELKKSGVF